MEQELLLYTLEKIYNREPLGIGYPLQSNISASGLRDDPEMIFPHSYGMHVFEVGL